GALPLLGHSRGQRDDQAQHDTRDAPGGRPRHYRCRGPRASERDEEKDRYDVRLQPGTSTDGLLGWLALLREIDHVDAPFEIELSSRRRSAAENPRTDASARARRTIARSS